MWLTETEYRLLIDALRRDILARKNQRRFDLVRERQQLLDRMIAEHERKQPTDSR